jgi:hypothetical protein
MNSGFKKNLPFLFIITILALYMLFESIKYHDETNYEGWKKELFADASGYYVYNLMWFENGYESKNYPDTLDITMGYGFSLKNKIIKDKYTCGVAYLQTPFVGGNRIASLITGRGGKPTSRDTNRIIDIAAMFYAWLAAIFLFYFLIHYVKKWIALVSIILIFAGTNVYYYAVFHPGMAHIYSFFLFSFYLFIGDRWLQHKKRIQFILVALTIFLIILIRPTDILFLPVLLFLRNSLKENLQLIFTRTNIIILAGAVILVWLPQCYYWKLSTGHLIYYSYENEGFTNILHPKINQVLFAPDNGLLPYSVLFILLLGANIYLVLNKHPYAIYFFVYQLITVYLIASWHVPNFGGAYGQRNFVQAFAGYSLILAIMLDKAFKNKFVFGFLILFSIGTIAVNQKIIHRYNHFYFGRYTWDWREYKYYLSNEHYQLKENFDNYKEPERTLLENNNRALHVNSMNEFYHIAKFGYNELPGYFKHMHYSLRVKPLETPLQLELCMTWLKKDSVIYYKTNPIQNKKFQPGKWKNIHEKTVVDASLCHQAPDSVFIYIWNIERKEFLVDDITICFE